MVVLNRIILYFKTKILNVLYNLDIFKYNKKFSRQSFTITYFIKDFNYLRGFNSVSTIYSRMNVGGSKQCSRHNKLSLSQPPIWRSIVKRVSGFYIRH